MTEYIRNFCIIAHIDHGKSTLADRLLELTGTVPPEEMKKQILDDMDLEQERGITIKAHAIAMNYRARDGKDYVLNLIDTPGHVDFSYEVSRSLAACEGALLVVDAAQGVEAQTISNFYLALESDLKIIPVINKIDLPGAQIEATLAQVTELTGCSRDEVLLVSAKLGTGVEKVLEAVVQKIPPSSGDSRAPLRALIFDSTYDSYRGAVAFIRLFDGELKIGDKICFMSSGKIFEAHEVGILKLKRIKQDRLQAGGVGYLICGAKDVRDMKVGDTITMFRNRAAQPLPGYREVKPMVFSGLYPVNSDDYPELRDSLERLRLNDSSFTFVPETSVALGFGYRCGFLGLLHMEIVQERLEREYGLSIINTVPTVAYRATTTDGKTLSVDSPAAFPNPGHHFRIEEPFIRGQIITP
ncbi:elongation factor 4, partial [candidate division KSB1 bacterium]|nr:elongation factor 4 [candidate division KSB1 bacterium]